MRYYLFVIFSFYTLFSYGQYPPSVGVEGTTAIKSNDINIIGWATACEVKRGWLNIADTTLGKTTQGSESDALGASDPAVISLGDGGEAILTFDTPVKNNEGFDFAVFENSFDDYFLEFAHVEVSTDGERYVRFPSVSLTDTTTQTNTFGNTTTSNIYNLAGKYRAQYGTPFDLAELKDSMAINIDSINYIKIIDVVGSVNSLYGSRDGEGNLINDPYPTSFESGGFDLDAVAILDESIVDGILEDNLVDFIYPNPAQKGQNITFQQEGILYNVVGEKVADIALGTYTTNNLIEGIYFFSNHFTTTKIIVY